MQSLRKLFVLAIAFALCFNTVAFGAEPSDATGNRDDQAVKLLSALKIIQGGSFDAEELITRAEFAVIMARILGLEDLSEEKDSDALPLLTDILNAESKTGTISATGPFNDVPLDYWAANSIKAVSDMGIIKGYGNGDFGPEDIVTYEQAVKIIMVALGYDLYAREKGGFPTGYLTAAAEKGVTASVQGTVGQSVFRGVVARLLYNALDVDIMEQIAFGGESKYSVSNNKTLLSKKLDIVKSRGRVTATGETRLNGESVLNDDEIEIENTLYKLGSTNGKEYLGYYVTYYYKQEKDSDIKTLVYIEAEQGKNKVLTVKADDIEDYSNHKLSYWIDKSKDSGIKTALISGNADTVYNGKAITDYPDSLMVPAAGKVVLIDNGGSSEYDTVIITAYSNFVVNDINRDDYTVYDKYNPNNKLVLDPADGSVKFTMKNKKGNEVAFGSLKEWDVLSVSQTLDTQQGSKVISIIVSNDKIEGSITEINTSADTVSQKVYVDKEYEIAANYSEVFEMNDAGTFYLDYEGKIAAYSEKSAADAYAYLVNAELLKGLSNTAGFKLYTEKGKFISCKSAEKVEVNGISGLKGDQVLSELAKSATESIRLSQFIRYRTDDENNICRIVTTNDGGDEINLLFKAPDKNTDGKEPTYSFRNGIKGFVDGTSASVNFGKTVTFIDNNTRIFFIPSGDKSKEDMYSTQTIKYFINDIYYAVKEVYVSKKDNRVADAVVLYNNSAGSSIVTNADIPIMLVDKVTKAVTDDGFDAYKLYGLKDGKQVSFICKDTMVMNTIATFQQGDAVRIETNNLNEITAAEMRFDASAQKIYTQSTTETNPYPMNPLTQFRLVYASVYSRPEAEPYILNIETLPMFGSNTTIKDCIRIDGFVFYKYDSEKKKVSLATASDIYDYKRTKVGSKILVYTRWMDPKIIVIYD